MRIATLYGPYCWADKNGFDFTQLLDDPRGLTGSEYGVVRVSQELATMGHDVTLYTIGKLVPEYGGVKLRPYDARGENENDWAICWNEAGSLRGTRAKVKACSLQINTVVGVPHGCEDPHGAADVWFCPSHSHMARLAGSSPGRWCVAHDGVDPHLYPVSPVKVPGRVVWPSSPDRGLHWLLACWPRIRKAVPHATLKVFYRVETWFKHFETMAEGHPEPSIAEQVRRVAYIKRVLPELEAHGVEVVGNVSRNRIVEEVTMAECVAYSCDPVIWSEGFSCSLMEACAASACPVGSQADAFPEIYGGVIPLAAMPLGAHLDEFVGHVVQSLTDQKYRRALNAQARAHAEKFTWKRMAEEKARVMGEVQSERAQARVNEAPMAQGVASV